MWTFRYIPFPLFSFNIYFMDKKQKINLKYGNIINLQNENIYAHLIQGSLKFPFMREKLFTEP